MTTTTDIPTEQTTDRHCHRQIFREELEVTIASPQTPQQLAAAVNAHAAFLDWDRVRTKDNWRRFIKKWSRVEA